jgi:transaldolase
MVVNFCWQERRHMTLENLKVKIFADGANLGDMLDLYENPLIKGFTTNPTLMRKAGISDYAAFAKEVLRAIPDRPISFEVFSDDFDEMEDQAFQIASWGKNVYVKIPITNTQGKAAYTLIRKLSVRGIKVNVTAVMTLEQTVQSAASLENGPHSYISVFAGRISDTGRDPIPLMTSAIQQLRPLRHLEIIWASPRELLNIFHADAVGCHVITVTHELLRKLALVGKDLNEYSLETVRMFYQDAKTAGYHLRRSRTTSA